MVQVVSFNYSADADDTVPFTYSFSFGPWSKIIVASKTLTICWTKLDSSLVVFSSVSVTNLRLLYSDRIHREKPNTRPISGVSVASPPP